GCYDVRRRRRRPGHARPTEQRVVEQEGGGREQDAYDRGDLDRQSQPPACPPDTAWNACSRTRHSQPSPAGPARAGTVAAVFPATGPFPITALGRVQVRQSPYEGRRAALQCPLQSSLERRTTCAAAGR